MALSAIHFPNNYIIYKQNPDCNAENADCKRSKVSVISVRTSYSSHHHYSIGTLHIGSRGLLLIGLGT